MLRTAFMNLKLPDESRLLANAADALPPVWASAGWFVCRRVDASPGKRSSRAGRRRQYKPLEGARREGGMPRMGRDLPPQKRSERCVCQSDRRLILLIPRTTVALAGTRLTVAIRGGDASDKEGENFRLAKQNVSLLQTVMTVSQGTDPGHGTGRGRRYTRSAPAHWRWIAMKIVVSASNRNPACPWQVQLDQHVVSFRSEAEARSFVALLEARLNAPHPLTQAGWPAGAGSALRH
ncbi:hypothetical protein PRtIB026_A51220 [Pseudomonas sp. RtIB026]|nr:hypothetical protein PRtIB026_A51220 [Pseudomonas sp. RtIB026]